MFNEKQMINKILSLALFLVSLYVVAQTGTTLKNGESVLTVDGERFHNDKIIFRPNDTGYDNMWFDNGKQKFTDINLVGNYDGHSVNFQFRFPGQKGTYTIEDNRNDTGSQNNDNNCYFLMSDKDGFGDGLGGQTGSVKVTVTRFDNPGGLIEGSITGFLVTGNDSNPSITISGNFSVIRGRDRKSF